MIGLEVSQKLLAAIVPRPQAMFGCRLSPRFSRLPWRFSLCLSALLIKLEDGGPVFYGNERIGLGGRKFKAWKLRSMVKTGTKS